MTSLELTVEIIHIGKKICKLCSEGGGGYAANKEKIHELERHLEELRTLRDMIEL